MFLRVFDEGEEVSGKPLIEPVCNVPFLTRFGFGGAVSEVDAMFIDITDSPPRLTLVMKRVKDFVGHLSCTTDVCKRGYTCLLSFGALTILLHAEG